MEGHARGLQRGGAEAIDGGAGDVEVDTRQQRRVAADVVARLALGEATAHHHVHDRAGIELRVAVQDRFQRDRREVIGAYRFERPLVGPPDGRAYGVDDHSFGHV
jgi:hypothetical protein